MAKADLSFCKNIWNLGWPLPRLLVTTSRWLPGREGAHQLFPNRTFHVTSCWSLTSKRHSAERKFHTSCLKCSFAPLFLIYFLSCVQKMGKKVITIIQKWFPWSHTLRIHGRWYIYHTWMVDFYGNQCRYINLPFLPWASVMMGYNSPQLTRKLTANSKSLQPLVIVRWPPGDGYVICENVGLTSKETLRYPKGQITSWMVLKPFGYIMVDNIPFLCLNYSDSWAGFLNHHIFLRKKRCVPLRNKN